ncbi:GDP-D-glucose phosphorylase 1-like [Ochlerotatus camptorhynchus]|uniref:GDP-D-glucose phosphorylase 1-like n=1 Tax=Ochlerotatus camptorhynchus TaxID=644619 RepID=UPI0031DDDAAB
MLSSSIPKLEDIDNLQHIIQSRWTELHDHQPEQGVFRYRLTIERERVTDDGRFGFLLQLNRKRTTERRKPDIMASVVPAFDPTRFNFNKVDSREVLLEVRCGGSLVSILINNSPLTSYHSLIVPDRDRNLPQVLTKESLEVAVSLLLRLEDRNYRIGYNSPGALASVNHLHFHLMHLNHKLYVEDAPVTALAHHLFRLDDHPARAYCFLLQPNTPPTHFAQRIYRLITILLSGNIAHNLLLTWNGSRDTLRALIYPRLRPCENKQVSPFNVAFCELSGFVPLGDESDYERLDELQLATYFREAQGIDESLHHQLDQTVLDGLGEDEG